jgi:hypothetical protein
MYTSDTIVGVPAEIQIWCHPNTTQNLHFFAPTDYVFPVIFEGSSAAIKIIEDRIATNHLKMGVDPTLETLHVTNLSQTANKVLLITEIIFFRHSTLYANIDDTVVAGFMFSAFRIW